MLQVVVEVALKRPFAVSASFGDLLETLLAYDPLPEPNLSVFLTHTSIGGGKVNATTLAPETTFAMLLTPFDDIQTPAGPTAFFPCFYHNKKVY